MEVEWLNFATREKIIDKQSGRASQKKKFLLLVHAECLVIKPGGNNSAKEEKGQKERAKGAQERI